LDHLLCYINQLNNLLVNINDLSHLYNNMSSLQVNIKDISLLEEILLQTSLPGIILSLMVIAFIVEFLDIELLIALKRKMLNLDFLECLT
jgi:hypothetical protein